MTDAATPPLHGQGLLVTGASSGIGRAIALAAAQAGADVALTYRTNEAGAREVAGEIQRLGRRAAVLPLDLADAAQVAGVGPAALSALGRLDAWVNNAGADILTGADRVAVTNGKAGPPARGGPARHRAGLVARR